MTQRQYHNSAVWMEKAHTAYLKAKEKLGLIEYFRRMNILWPDTQDRSFKETCEIMIAILEDERWKGGIS